MLNTPIGLIFFNRPEKLNEVFKTVKAIKPKKLFLIQDGPRKLYNDDIKKIMECRSIVENVDWDCKIYKNYSETNLGCGLRPATGIDWIFSIVEKCIILEDDCVPSISFYNFCEELLEKYEKNSEIFLISGMNLLEETPIEESYLFSQACTIGAWATWRRAWKHYDYTLKQFDSKNSKKTIKKNIVNKKMRIAKFSAWDITRRKLKANEKIDWWDFQFHFQLFLNNAVGIIPKNNLVKNIGFGEDATNISDSQADHFNVLVYNLNFPLIHPKDVEINETFDEMLFNKQFSKVSNIRVALSYIKRSIIYGIRKE